MAESKLDALRSIGFVTVRRNMEHGYFGGYLIVNSLGRPLEFHCTLPVKPSRAQEILYGPTLDDFICGEQIAKALTAKAKLTANLILTDCEVTLASRNVSEQPIACVRSQRTERQTAVGLAIPKTASSNLIHFELGKNSVCISSRFPQDEQAIKKCWGELGLEIDVLEPFERIEEALLEAHPAARAA